MVGAPVALPTAPMSARRRHPPALPTRIARRALPRPSPGTRNVPASMTRSPMPEVPPENEEIHEAQHAVVPGTGSIPHSGGVWNRGMIFWKAPCGRHELLFKKNRPDSRGGSMPIYRPCAGIIQIRFNGSAANSRPLSPVATEPPEKTFSSEQM